jgi:hypothetical protein
VYLKNAFIKSRINIKICLLLKFQQLSMVEEKTGRIKTPEAKAKGDI